MLEMNAKTLIFISFLIFIVSCGNDGKSVSDVDSEIDDHDISGWSEVSADEMSVHEAFSYCEDLEESGNKDWRLPKISELRSLIINCEKTETGGNCKVDDDCHDPYNDCMSYFCNGCGLSGSDYSKLGDKLLLLSGSWFEHIPDVCDECAEADSEIYAASVYR